MLGQHSDVNQNNQNTPVVAGPSTPPTPSKKDFEAEALFAAQHGNAPLLALLLFPGPSPEERKKLDELAVEINELRNKKNSVEVKINVVIEAIEALESRFNKGELTSEFKSKLESSYKKEVELKVQATAEISSARSTSFHNGQALKASREEQQDYIDAFRKHLESEKEKFFASKPVEDILITRVTTALQELDSLEKARKELITEYEALETQKTAKDTDKENIGSDLAHTRHKLIQAIMAMNQDEKKFPMRYRDVLHNEAELKSRLLCAAGAHLDVKLIRDDKNNNLLHYALKNPYKDVVKLIFDSNGGVLLFMGNAAGKTPYQLISRHGDNELMRMAQAVFSKDSAMAQLGEAFHTSDSIQRLRKLEQLVLSFAGERIEHYRTVGLPKRDNRGWFYSEQCTAARKAMVTRLELALASAKQADSWHIFCLTMEAVYTELNASLFWFERSLLFNELERIRQEAENQLTQSHQPWYWIQHLEALMDHREELEAQLAQFQSLVADYEAMVKELRAEKAAGEQEIQELKSSMEAQEEQRRIDKEAWEAKLQTQEEQRRIDKGEFEAKLQTQEEQRRIEKESQEEQRRIDKEAWEARLRAQEEQRRIDKEEFEAKLQAQAKQLEAFMKRFPQPLSNAEVQPNASSQEDENATQAPAANSNTRPNSPTQIVMHSYLRPGSPRGEIVNTAGAVTPATNSNSHHISNTN